MLCYHSFVPKMAFIRQCSIGGRVKKEYTVLATVSLWQWSLVSGVYILHSL